MPAIIDRLVKNVFKKAVVSHKEKIAEGAFRIRIQGDSFKGHVYAPGAHLRLFVGLDKDTALNEKLRTYSIWAHNSVTGDVDLAVCTHSSGVGAIWAQYVAVGEVIHYMGPSDKLTVDSASSSALMIGDASALSHLYAIKRGVPGKGEIRGLIYAADKDELFPDIDGSLPFRFLELPADPAEQLISEINAIKNELPGDTVAYLGGDARTCKALGRYFRQELQWDGRRVRSKGFWMPGKTGMD